MQSQPRSCFRFGIAGVALAALLLPSAALATYSIAATDSQTQEVGGAITSCVGTLDVGIVYGSLPGVGVIHAQAQLDQRGRAKMRALMLLEQGSAPAEIISEITRPELDQAFASRQYGIVDLSGRAAGFTGERAQAYKNDQQGMFGTFAYSVQGNILTSQAVLDQATEAFQEPACDLAERLMRALEAGAENGEGDSRCTGDGIPSDSAFIQVDRPGQSEPYLQLSIAGTRPNDPLPRLRDMFDDWRRTHPCPASMSPAAGSGGAMASAGVGATGAAGSAMASAAGGAAGAGPTGAAGSGGTGQPAGTTAAGSGGMSAAGSGGIAAAGGVGAPAPTSAAGNTASAATVAGTGAAGRAALPTTPSLGSSGSGPTTPAAASGTTSSMTNAVDQAAQSAQGGCTATPGQRHTGAGRLIGMVVLFALCARRRRSVRTRRDVPAKGHGTDTRRAPC